MSKFTSCIVALVFCIAALITSGCGALGPSQPATADCPNQATVSGDKNLHVGDVNAKNADLLTDNARTSCPAHFHATVQFRDPKRQTQAAGIPPVEVQFTFTYPGSFSPGTFNGHTPTFIQDPVVGGEWVWDFTDHITNPLANSAFFTTHWGLLLQAKQADSVYISGNIGFSKIN